MSDTYSLCESKAYFGCLDGRLRSPLFGHEIEFLVKGGDETYGVRCAEYFEKITAENLEAERAFRGARRVRDRLS